MFLERERERDPHSRLFFFLKKKPRLTLLSRHLDILSVGKMPAYALLRLFICLLLGIIATQMFKHK